MMISGTSEHPSQPYLDQTVNIQVDWSGELQNMPEGAQWVY